MPEARLGRCRRGSGAGSPAGRRGTGASRARCRRSGGSRSRLVSARCGSLARGTAPCRGSSAAASCSPSFHLPLFPSASRAASSSAVGRRPDRGARPCRRGRRLAPRRSCGPTSPIAGGPRGPSPARPRRRACGAAATACRRRRAAAADEHEAAAAASRRARSKWRSPASIAVERRSSPSASSHVPQSHTITSPPPYSPRGDDALEVEVVERMVLDVDGHALHVGVERRTLRHRPAHEHAVVLETEVVVQAAGPVALHDEPLPSVDRRAVRLRPKARR